MPEGSHPHGRERRGRPRATLPLRRELSLCLAAALAAIAASCDQGKQHDTVPATPYIHLVSANVGTSTPLPADGQIELTFDRLLNPVSVVRQSVVLRNADDSPIATPPVISYDPVALKVTISDPDPKMGGPGHAWLTPTAFYKVTLGIPAPGSFGGGLRAIDGQTLDPASTLVIGFTAAPPANAPTCMTDADCKLAYAPVCDAATSRCRAPKMRFCDDIQPIFVNRCSSGQCHGAPVTGGPQLPAEGLILETSLGVTNTAIGRVSNEANTGALAGRAQEPGRAFAVNMPIIDPGIGAGGDPGNSWMMYKLLLAPPSDASGDGGAIESTRPCGPGPTKLAPPLVPSAAMSDAERAILSDYVLGREMPYPTFPGGVPQGKTNDNPPLTLAQLERLRLWIAQGAPVDTCTCQ